MNTNFGFYIPYFEYTPRNILYMLVYTALSTGNLNFLLRLISNYIKLQVTPKTNNAFKKSFALFLVIEQNEIWSILGPKKQDLPLE